MRTLPRFLLAALLALPIAATLHAPPARADAPRNAPSIDENLIGRTADGRLYARNRLVVRLRAGSASLGALRPGRAGAFSLGGTALESTMRGAGVSAVRPAVTEALRGAIPRAFGLDERWLVLELEPGRDALAASLQLSRQFEVELAEPDWVARTTLVPNDSLYSKNWGHKNNGTFKAVDITNVILTGDTNHDSTVSTTLGFDTNAESAWSQPQGYGSTDVIVGIIDSGADLDHADLSPNLVPGWDFTSNDNNPDEGIDAHGTECAGITAAVANNTRGAVGIAGRVKIMPLRCKASNNGSGTVGLIYAGQAVLYGIANGVDILSMSFGGFTYPGDFFKRATASAESAGVLMFAATGNSNSTSISYPAKWPGVIAVGAASPCASRKRSSQWPGLVNPGVSTDSLGASCDNEFWWGSSYGVAVKDDSAAVDVIAPTILPTTDILGAGGSNATDYNDFFNGTSCATPYAAGVAALIKSRFSNITAAQVRDRLMNTAIDVSDLQTPVGWDKYTGYGMVDAYQAVRAPDITPYTPGGWSDHIVPRGTNDSPGVLPATLPGDATNYVSSSVVNFGGWSYASSVWRNRLDGVAFVSYTGAVLPPNTYTWYHNFPFSVRGGLHTLETNADHSNLNIESNEANNDYGRQFSWIPSVLAVNTSIARSEPPSPLGGTSSVSGTIYPNVDGLRIGPRVVGYWQGAALRAAANDYDLYLFDLTTGTDDGFRTPLVTSSFGGSLTDFVIVNYNQAPNVQRDIGVRNWSGSGVSNVELRQSPSTTALSLGASLVDVPMSANQMIYLNEYFHVPNAANPRILFDLTTSPSQDLHLALFDPATTVARRADALYDVKTDASGRAVIDAPLPTAGANAFYGVVVYRDAADGGTDALTFDLSIRATPPDLALYEGGSWIDYLVPDNSSPVNVTLPPAQLDGNLNNTFLTYGYQNAGAQTASGYTIRELIDGANTNTWGGVSLGPGVIASTSTSSRTVRGGRHTLGYILDFGNSIAETYEDNNAYANQWVWSPLQMAMNTPLTRSMPPAAEGGWTEIPAAITRYDNSDGLRSPLFVASGADAFWGAVAAVPGPGTDIDLDWYDLSTGPTSGFSTPSFTSADGVNRTELMISDHSITDLQFDVGVINVSGSAAYGVQFVQSTWAGSDPPKIGPSMIPAGEIAKVFEFGRGTTAPLQALLENLSGNADLGISLYRFDGTISPMDKSGGLAYVDAGGPGDDEAVMLNTNLAGAYIAVAVYKTQSSELNKTATFQIHLGTPSNVDVGDPLPAAMAFAVAGANPVSEGAQLRFDLPEARNVALEVFDVQGHRVRTLAEGTFEAGMHYVSWHGNDDGGRRLGSGLYFVRFTSGSFTRVSKLTLVR